MSKNTVLSVDHAEANNGGGANDDAKSMTGLCGGLGTQRSGGSVVVSLAAVAVTGEELTVDVDIGGIGDLRAS